MPLAEGDAEDGTGGVGPDAWEGDELAVVARNRTTVPSDESPAGGVEAPRASIVAKAGPVPQHLIERCRREVRHRWESLDEALVEWDDALDLSLLEHHLRDPDSVGIPSVAPRQVAPVAGEPRQQAGRDVLGLWGANPGHALDYSVGLPEESWRALNADAALEGRTVAVVLAVTHLLGDHFAEELERGLAVAIHENLLE
jgi:hypothetical protein